MEPIYNPETHLGGAIAAVGALGTAAAGVVDAFKSLPGGGISNAGFGFIEEAAQPFFNNVSRATAAAVFNVRTTRCMPTGSTARHSPTRRRSQRP